MPTLEEAHARVRARFPKEAFSLEFKRLSDYAIQCKCCGQFYVGKVTVNGHETFEVFFKAQGKSALLLRQNLPTGTDAKAWASSLASAYKRGTLGLSVPPSPEEIAAADRLKSPA
jgi:hypothetical protein